MKVNMAFVLRRILVSPLRVSRSALLIFVASCTYKTTNTTIINCEDGGAMTFPDNWMDGGEDDDELIEGDATPRPRPGQAPPGRLGIAQEGDHRILDPAEYGMLGQVYTFLNPTAAQIIAGYDQLGNAIATNVADKSGSQFNIPPVAPNELGLTRLQRFFPGRKLSARNQKNPSIITLAIESVVISLEPGTDQTASYSLQGVLSFGTGAGNQGQQPAVNLAAITGTIQNADGRIIFDIDTGALISFPTAFFQLDFLLTTVAFDPGYNVVGQQISPGFQVSFSLGYEPQVHLGEVTMTQMNPTRTLASAASVFFARPKYSSGVFFTWNEWNTAARSPVQVDFFNGTGRNVWSLITYTNGSIGGVGASVPVILPWPVDAVTVSVFNLTAGGGPITNLRCVSLLEF